MADDFNLDDYFRRIKYDGPRSPELGTLRALHARHVNAIPFENLDPLTDRPVRLDLSSLQAKLIHSRRGGYCFEQNLLFKAVLERLGFRVTGLAARVRWMVPPDRPLGPRSHMLLRVELTDGPYLADVGFGAQLLDAPLSLEPDIEQTTASGCYRLTRSDQLLTLATQITAGWQSLYVFNLEPQELADYEVGNWYTSTHPQMWFRKRLLIERLAPEARYTLSNTQLSERTPEGTRRERKLETAAEFGQALDQIFGLTPPVPAEQVYAKLAPA